MDASKIYAVVAGGIPILFVQNRLFLRICHFVQDNFFLKHFVYPYIYRRTRFLEPMTWSRLLLQSMYWLLNAAFHIVGVHNVDQAGNRAGVLSVLNLVPLFLASQVSLVADLLGVSLRTYLQIHGTIGFVATLQALAHVSVQLKTSTFSFGDSLQFYGFLV